MGALKTIFLDSDGIINEPIIVDGKPLAPRSVDELIIPKEVSTCCEQLKAAGFLLVTVTNKPDVAEGRMTQADVDAIFKKIQSTLPITEIFACYDRQAPCFKPKPGLLLEAAKKYGIDIPNSFMIGDRNSDVAAGQAAGCKTIWINREYAVQEAPNPPADFTTHSLTEATRWILEEHTDD